MWTLVLTGGHSGVRTKCLLKLVGSWEHGLCALYVALLGSHCLKCGKTGGAAPDTWDAERGK